MTNSFTVHCTFVSNSFTLTCNTSAKLLTYFLSWMNGTWHVPITFVQACLRIGMETSFLQEVLPQLPPRKTSEATAESLSLGVVQSQSRGQTANIMKTQCCFWNSKRETLEMCGKSKWTRLGMFAYFTIKRELFWMKVNIMVTLQGVAQFSTGNCFIWTVRRHSI